MEIKVEDNLQRIDKYLSNKIEDKSRSFIQGLIDEEKVKAEYEARLAISLKRLKFRYITMKRSDSLPLENGDIVREIIKEADALELWDIDFPIRTARPSEDELTGDGFMELTSAQQRFLELYNKGLEDGRRGKVVFYNNPVNNDFNNSSDMHGSLDNIDV